MSSDRRSLLSVGSDVRGMRNWPLFLFLTGLVFFFYFLYVYQSQSAEYATVRSELEAQLQKIQDLKMDFVNAKAENERLKALENDFKSDKDRLAKENEFCSKSLRSCKLDTESLQSDKKTFENKLRDKDVTIESLQLKIEELTKSSENLKKAVSDQKAISDQLQGTVERLEAELVRLKGNATGKGNSVQNGTTRIGDAGPVATDFTRRSAEVNQEQRNIVNDKLVGQAPAPVVGQIETNIRKVKQASGDREEIKDEREAPPKKPGDRVKLAVAAEERSKEEKPVVSGGNYDGIEDMGDDLQGRQ